MHDWSQAVQWLGGVIAAVSCVWAAAISDSLKGFAVNFAMQFVELAVMALVAMFFGAYVYAALFA